MSTPFYPPTNTEQNAKANSADTNAYADSRDSTDATGAHATIRVDGPDTDDADARADSRCYPYSAAHADARNHADQPAIQLLAAESELLELHASRVSR